MASTPDNPDSPLVSVIIPAYNARDFVADAIHSALSQDHPAVEVIVCDDASTDDTAEVVRRFEPRVTLVRMARNGGIGAARNAAIAASSGAFLAPLDADDMFLPGKLAAQVRVMIERPNVAVCHTGTELFGGESGDGPIIHDVRRRIDGMCFAPLVRRNGIVIASAMMRRSMMPAEGFQTDVQGVEDYAMWMEMLFDHEAAYLPQVLTRYRRHPAQMTADKGRQVQVNSGVARLRALDRRRSQMNPAEFKELYQWTLEELEICSMSRYHHGDLVYAHRGFRELASHGRRVPWKPRLRAWLLHRGRAR